MNINNLERLNNAANANNIQLEQTVRITTNINNGVVRTTDVQYDIIRHAEATIEERPRFPGTPQFARVEPVPVERELETGVQAGDNIINEIINRANEHANTVTTTQDIIPLDGQITFLNT